MLTAARRRFQRLNWYRTQFGLWATVKLFLGRALMALSRSRLLLFVTLDRDRPQKLAAPPEGFECRFLTPDEVRRHALDPANDLQAEFVARAEAGMDLCYGALDGDVLAAYGWYALASIEPEHNVGLAVSYPSDQAFMYKGYTRHEYRGLRLHGLCMGLALEDLGSRGVRSLVSVIDWDNFASRRSSARIGYREVGCFLAFFNGRRCLVLPSRTLAKRGVRTGRAADLAARLRAMNKAAQPAVPAANQLEPAH
jgi:hypothetical protein